MSSLSTLLDLSSVSTFPPPPDPIPALMTWKTGIGPGRNRSWQLTSWGDGAIRLTLSWTFGAGQVAGIDRYAPSVTLRSGPTASVGYLVAAVLKSFADWQTDYQAARPADPATVADPSAESASGSLTDPPTT